VGSLQEGFENLPKSMGSDYRHRTPIKTWKDGFSQAGSGFAYGLMDGITGLVTEPIVGAHQDVGILSPTSTACQLTMRN
jgi:hypothetical protein